MGKKSKFGFSMSDVDPWKVAIMVLLAVVIVLSVLILLKVDKDTEKYTDEPCTTTIWKLKDFTVPAKASYSGKDPLKDEVLVPVFDVAVQYNKNVIPDKTKDGNAICFKSFTLSFTIISAEGNIIGRGSKGMYGIPGDKPLWNDCMYQFNSVRGELLPELFGKTVSGAMAVISVELDGKEYASKMVKKMSDVVASVDNKLEWNQE